MEYTISIDMDHPFKDGQGNILYRAKGFKSLVFDEAGLVKLEQGGYSSALVNEMLQLADSKAYDRALSDVTNVVSKIKSIKRSELIKCFPGYPTKKLSIREMIECLRKYEEESHNEHNNSAMTKDQLKEKAISVIESIGDMDILPDYSNLNQIRVTQFDDQGREYTSMSFTDFIEGLNNQIRLDSDSREAD